MGDTLNNRETDTFHTSAVQVRCIAHISQCSILSQGQEREGGRE